LRFEIYKWKEKYKWIRKEYDYKIIPLKLFLNLIYIKITLIVGILINKMHTFIIVCSTKMFIVSSIIHVLLLWLMLCRICCWIWRAEYGWTKEASQALHVQYIVQYRAGNDVKDLQLLLYLVHFIGGCAALLIRKSSIIWTSEVWRFSNFFKLYFIKSNTPWRKLWTCFANPKSLSRIPLFKFYNWEI
jgi:hypothetical protein